MKDFLATMYELLRSFYGQDLADHLYGLNHNNTGAFDEQSLYVTIGLTLFVTSVALPVLYYKIVDKPQLAKLPIWFILALIHTAINTFVGFWLPYLDWDTGKMAKVVHDAIGSGNCWGFGFANGIFAFIYFFLVSYLLKRFSTNSKTVPF
jgi:hypothetical protein